MKLRWGVGIAASALIALTACTGGKETNAAEEQLPKKNPIATTSASSETQPNQAAATAGAEKELKTISRAIPIYAGAEFREDLTKRDQVMIRNQYGANARVFTMATDDSYPQVYHYYTTYLAQFRAYPPTNPYPPGQQNWRTLEVQLNQAMQDPFIPGDTIKAGDNQVTLQVAETEAEPKTVIRYIVTPPAGAPAPAAAGR